MADGVHTDEHDLITHELAKLADEIEQQPGNALHSLEWAALAARILNHCAPMEKAA